MVKVLIISLLFFQGRVLNTPNITLNFDIILHKKVVGSLKFTQITKDGMTYYQSVTNIKTRLIKDILVVLPECY